MLRSRSAYQIDGADTLRAAALLRSRNHGQLKELLKQKLLTIKYRGGGVEIVSMISFSLRKVRLITGVSLKRYEDLI